MGGRLIATSDRDIGLYLFRYTGDGAAPTIPAPECNNVERGDGGHARSTIPLSCTDANGEPR